MSKEIGPREKALREARERTYEENHRAAPKVAALREKVASIPAKKAKKKKAKR